MAIRIEPFRGTSEEWFDKLSAISEAVAWQDAKHARRFFESLSAEREYFRRHPLDPQKVSRMVFESVFGAIDDRARMARGR